MKEKKNLQSARVRSAANLKLGAMTKVQDQTKLKLKPSLVEMSQAQCVAKFNIQMEKVRETAKKQKEAHLRRAHEAARRRQVQLDQQKKVLQQTSLELVQARMKHEAAQKNLQDLKKKNTEEVKQELATSNAL